MSEPNKPPQEVLACNFPVPVHQAIDMLKELTSLSEELLAIKMPALCGRREASKQGSVPNVTFFEEGGDAQDPNSIRMRVRSNCDNPTMNYAFVYDQASGQITSVTDEGYRGKPDLEKMRIFHPGMWMGL